jgi:hypothetical protein
MRFYPNEYHVWRGMKQRILNSAQINYQYYGGRGLDIDPNWMKFNNFYNDMGSRPGKEYTLERVDNNKGYWKWNCKWATRTEQAYNRRDNRKFQYNGKDLF